MTDNIYISSITMSKIPLKSIIAKCQVNGWGLEFSSNIKYQEDLVTEFKLAGIKKIAHNYFPAPEVPFVLNLASKNLEIRNKSIEHCKNGIDLAVLSDAPFFAAHAGFCIDPTVNELGNKINYAGLFNKAEHTNLFIESLKSILDYADENSVNFLIENNVLTKFNYNKNLGTPFLCCDSSEIIDLMNRVQRDNLFLLLDTAHLKVSCTTLNLNLHKEVEKISPYVKAVHHSDNDGLVDNNLPIDESYWFLPYMKQYADIVHVIEVANISYEKIVSQIDLLGSLL